MSSLRRSQRIARSRGQSLAEFALFAPVLLLLLLTAIDFGRAFYSWVTLTNASRIAASYASAHPTDAYPNASYTGQYQADTNVLTSVCPLQGGPFLPQFIDGPDSGTSSRDPGDSTIVTMSCDFRIITPVISAVFGGANVRISTSSTFPVRSGAFLP